MEGAGRDRHAARPRRRMETPLGRAPRAHARGSRPRSRSPSAATLRARHSPSPLHPGTSVDVREHIFMVATHSVTYDWFQSGVWFQTRSGDETERPTIRSAMLMDRFAAPAGARPPPHPRPRERLHPAARAGGAHPREAVGLPLQGPHRLRALALRASTPRRAKHLGVGRTLHVGSGPLGARSDRRSIGVRALARSREASSWGGPQLTEHQW